MPISINSYKEESNLECFDGVSVKFIERDSEDITGKPLIYLDDMIKSVLQEYNGPIAITNSDIVIDLSESILYTIKHLQPGEGIISNRKNITEPNSKHGCPFRFGYDLFVFHTEDLKRLDFGSLMIIGAPWWDHFLPISMINLGVKISAPRNPVAYHLVHDNRWEKDLWVKMGLIYFDLASKYIQPRNSAILRYKKNINDITSRAPPLKFAKQYLTSLLLNSKKNDYKLKALSNVNIEFIISMTNDELMNQNGKPAPDPDFLIHRNCRPGCD